MICYIFLSLQGYPGKWAHSLPKGRSISVPDLLACMYCMFGNIPNYDTMIWSLYEIQQKDSETVEEYMLQIHEAMEVIHHAYPDRISDQGKNLTRDQFYHSLLPGLQDALSFAMADLPKWEQANTSFDMLYMQAKKLEVRQPLHSQKGGSGSSHTYRDRFRRYPASSGRVVTLEDKELFLPDPKARDSPPNRGIKHANDPSHEPLSVGGA